MAKTIIKMHPEFGDELNDLAKYFDQWADDADANLWDAMREIGQRHKAEAVKRAPVDSGDLQDYMITNTYRSGDEIITETGTNLGYGTKVEFGDRRIAGGRVQALGDDPLISDAEAIKHWPAKDMDATSGNREQMPWLRPAWYSIKRWAGNKLLAALRSPRQR